MANERIDFIRTIAEQSYSFHLLVKALQEKGILAVGEPMNRWDEAEFEKFFLDFRGDRFPGVS